MTAVAELFRLDGQVALVTGGGAGIGEAICLLYAEAGAAVACTDLNAADAEAVANECRQMGAAAVGLKLDVTSEDDRARVVEAVAAQFDRRRLRGGWRHGSHSVDYPGVLRRLKLRVGRAWGPAM